jgi:hypothetical protein
MSPGGPDVVAEFRRAWADAGNTAVELPLVDVNQVLHDAYDVGGADSGGDLVYTRDMLWDMELRKAAAPDVYLPSVVRPGSLRKWPAEPSTDFVRVSEQRLWLDRTEFGLVLEQVHVDADRHSVYFVGVGEVVPPDGRTLRAGTGQPLFHVEHYVEGPADRPLNGWRIVHVTAVPDTALIERFAAMAADPFLREFVEIHIRDVVGRSLTRRTLG